MREMTVFIPVANLLLAINRRNLTLASTLLDVLD